jgi:hypothetical protein
MADKGLRRLLQEACHCSRCRADAPGAGSGASEGRRKRNGPASQKPAGPFHELLTALKGPPGEPTAKPDGAVEIGRQKR